MVQSASCANAAMHFASKEIASHARLVPNDRAAHRIWASCSRPDVKVSEFIAAQEKQARLAHRTTLTLPGRAPPVHVVVPSPKCRVEQGSRSGMAGAGHPLSLVFSLGGVAKGML